MPIFLLLKYIHILRRSMSEIPMRKPIPGLNNLNYSEFREVFYGGKAKTRQREICLPGKKTGGQIEKPVNELRAVVSDNDRDKKTNDNVKQEADVLRLETTLLLCLLISAKLI